MIEKDTLYARMISGELSQAEIDSLKQSGEWDEIQKIIKYADDLDLPRYNKDKGMQQVKVATQQTDVKIRTLKPLLRISAAASILILIGILSFFQFRLTTISSEYANNKTYQFKDKSIVMLNDGSYIKFNHRKWDKNRKIELTGEAFFQVEKGSPFIVATKPGFIEVLGTSFNVRSWNEKLYVECYTGKVKVSSNNQEFILTKGELVHFSNGKDGIKSERKNQSPSWLHAESTFYEEDLNAVFDELERQFNVKIITPLFKEKFTGSFTHNSLENALNQICTPMGVKFKINAEQNTITILK